MRPYRTVLEQKIRERRMTLEEFATYAETFAREHGEPGTLSLRHLQRLVAGKGPKGQPLGPIRPATARLLERIFETDSSELIASPMQTVAPPDAAAELRERIQKARRVDTGLLQGIRDQLNSIRRIDRQYGAIVTHNELLAKISQTRDLLTYSLNGNVRGDLAILLSEMYALAGWQCFDMGYCSASWSYYEQAKAAALEADDIAHQAHTKAEQALTLIDLGETAAAVSLIGSTRGEGQQRFPLLLRAWLAAAYGEALAAAGSRGKSEQLFDEAENRLERSTSNFQGPYVVLDSNHLARWRGHAAARSGRTSSSDLLANALEGMDPTFARAESALRVDLSAALITLGETVSARAELRRANRLALSIGSARQLARIRAFKQAI